MFEDHTSINCLPNYIKMAGTKVPQVFLLFSLMIFSTHAMARLAFRLSDGIGVFNYDGEIIIDDDGKYVYCNIDQVFKTKDFTTKVIVYIQAYTKMSRSTLIPKHFERREEIARTLSGKHYELLYLGLAYKICINYKFVVGEFLVRKIEFNRTAVDRFETVTIGENCYNLDFESSICPLKQYEDEPDIFDGHLRSKLESITAKY